MKKCTLSASCGDGGGRKRNFRQAFSTEVQDDVFHLFSDKFSRVEAHEQRCPGGQVDTIPVDTPAVLTADFFAPRNTDPYY